MKLIDSILRWIVRRFRPDAKFGTFIESDIYWLDTEGHVHQFSDGKVWKRWAEDG